jgi:hypothetical protein
VDTNARFERVPKHQGRDWRRRAVIVFAALVSVAVLTAARSSWSAGNGSSPPTPTKSGGTVSTGGGGSTMGGELPGSPTHHMSGTYSGSFSVDFARCMRSHGVPNFPNPNGTADQVAKSGVDTLSATFQNALYGPCKELAPPDWVSAPPLGTPPGSSLGFMHWRDPHQPV